MSSLVAPKSSRYQKRYVSRKPHISPQHPKARRKEATSRRHRTFRASLNTCVEVAGGGEGKARPSS